MEEMEEVSLEEMLARTINILNEIEVPMRYAERIAMPIWQAIGNLKTCIDAMKPKDGEKDVPD